LSEPQRLWPHSPTAPLLGPAQRHLFGAVDPASDHINIVMVMVMVMALVLNDM